MPIKPENAKRYPHNWKDIRAAVLQRAGNRCEGSPMFPDCRAKNGEPHPVTGSMVVCTTAHIDHDDLETTDINRLLFLCNRCHLTMDAKQHAQNARITRHKRKAMRDLFDVG